MTRSSSAGSRIKRRAAVLELDPMVDHVAEDFALAMLSALAERMACAVLLGELAPFPRAVERDEPRGDLAPALVVAFVALRTMLIAPASFAWLRAAWLPAGRGDPARHGLTKRLDRKARIAARICAMHSLCSIFSGLSGLSVSARQNNMRARAYVRARMRRVARACARARMGTKARSPESPENN
jgi:hypothetical protein